MGFVADFLWFLDQCRTVGLASNTRDLLLSTLAAAALAGVCAFVGNFYTRLWNRRYHLTRVHRFLSIAAGLLSFAFALAYFSVGYMPQVAQAVIDEWQNDINSNEAFAATALETAYVTLRKLHPEEMAGVPVPANNNNTLKLPGEACQIDAATSLATQATDNFRMLHPFLSLIATPIVPKEAVEQDSEKFW